jgi:putative addiction module component (TIGR02574 family)
MEPAKKMPDAISRMTPSERLELVDQLLDSLDRPDAEIDALWAHEAEDRLAAYRRGEIGSVTLSEMLAKHASR